MFKDLLIDFKRGMPVHGYTGHLNALPTSLVRCRFLVHYRLFPKIDSWCYHTIKCSDKRSLGGPLNALIDRQNYLYLSGGTTSRPHLVRFFGGVVSSTEGASVASSSSVLGLGLFLGWPGLSFITRFRAMWRRLRRRSAHVCTPVGARGCTNGIGLTSLFSNFRRYLLFNRTHSGTKTGPRTLYFRILLWCATFAAECSSFWIL